MKYERKKKGVLVLGAHGRMSLNTGAYKECRGSERSIEGLHHIGGRRYKCPRCGSTIDATPKYNVRSEMSWLLDELRDLYEEAEAFSLHGNKAAGTRLRKGCLEAQRRLKKIRDMVQQCKQEMAS